MVEILFSSYDNFRSAKTWQRRGCADTTAKWYWIWVNKTVAAKRRLNVLPLWPFTSTCKENLVWQCCFLLSTFRISTEVFNAPSESNFKSTHEPVKLDDVLSTDFPNSPLPLSKDYLLTADINGEINISYLNVYTNENKVKQSGQFTCWLSFSSCIAVIPEQWTRCESWTVAAEDLQIKSLNWKWAVD